MFPLYLVSHFNPAFELLVVLIVYGSFQPSGYFLETFSVYLLVIGLMWTPLVFNPNGLDFTYARFALCWLVPESADVIATLLHLWYTDTATFGTC